MLCKFGYRGAELCTIALARVLPCLRCRSVDPIFATRCHGRGAVSAMPSEALCAPRQNGCGSSGRCRGTVAGAGAKLQASRPLREQQLRLGTLASGLSSSSLTGCRRATAAQPPVLCLGRPQDRRWACPQAGQKRGPQPGRPSDCDSRPSRVVSGVRCA